MLLRSCAFTALFIIAVLALPTSSAADTTAPYGILVNQIDHTSTRTEIAARMENARQANASWVRVDFFWYSNEWTKGTIDWRFYDAVVQEADARGLRIIAILWGTPSWATTDGVSYYGVPDMTAWENFVFRTASRYRSVVDIWQIWNEPDAPFYWRGTPAQYAEVLARASTQIRAADPAALVAFGGLAQGGTVVADFLQRVLANPTYPAGRYIDLHAFHTNFRTMSGIASQVTNNRNILAQYGVHVPMIVTEASYTSDPVYQTLPGYVGGGEETQARYVLDAYHAMLTNGVAVAVWATGQDYRNYPGPYAASGLARLDRSPKKAYDAFRNMAWNTPTPPPPPIAISDLTVATGTDSAGLRWTTNVPGTSVAQYGTTSTSLTSSRSDGTLLTAHALSLTGLTSGTTYYVRVTSKAADGTSATSDVLRFTTAGTAPPPPIAISNPTVDATGTDSAALRWTTNVPGTSVALYGTTSTSLTSSRSDGTLLTSHALSLTGLTSGTTYYVRVTSKAADGTSATSDVLRFTTAGTAPPPPIAISNPTVEAIGTGSAALRWTTNVPGTSVAQYGTTSTSLTSSRSDGTLLTAHALSLTGLTSGTTYYVRVTSEAADGTSATSDVLRFTTAGTIAISNPTVEATGAGSAALRWTTNVPGTSVAQYGTTSSSLTSSRSDGTLLTSHALSLTGLASGTTYYVRVTSKAADGTSATSDVLRFTTAGTTETPAPYGILVNDIDHTSTRTEIAARMENARQANASWVRVDFFWYSNEWTKGTIDWRYYDAVAQEADARGLRIIAILWGTPLWATTDGISYFGVTDMTAWENFVFRTASRYRSVVDIWQIWHQPDAPFYWRGTPAQYAEVLARASTQIRAADPAALVALGGLAQGGTVVADFLQQVLANPTYPAGRYIDLHAFHTNFRTMSGIASQVTNNRNILAQYGVHVPMIVTEASYTSDPVYQTLPGYVGGGEETQARYVLDAYHAMLTNGVAVAVWGTGQDYRNATGPYAASGLARLDRSPKKAYDAFRNMAWNTPTPPPPPIAISDLTVATGTDSAGLRWTTNVPGTSVAQYGTTSTSLTSSRSDGTLLTAHALSLTGLTSGTTYYVRVTSKAADGTSATSDVLRFTTAGTAPPPPIAISNPTVDATGTDSAALRWTTNVPGTSVALYGTTSTSLTSKRSDGTLVTSHALSLTGLTSGTTYYVRVTSKAADGTSATSNVLRFTTAGTAPPPPIAISNLTAEATGTGTAVLRWTTNVPGTSVALYGTTSTSLTSRRSDGTLVTSHALNLKGLTSGTTYYVRVRSRAADGTLATSGVLPFTTAPPPPIAISNPTVEATGTGSAALRWTTNVPGTSIALYGTTSSSLTSKRSDATLVTSHALSLTGLTSGTTYYVRVRSRAANGTLATSGVLSFTTMGMAPLRP